MQRGQFEKGVVRKKEKRVQSNQGVDTGQESGALTTEACCVSGQGDKARPKQKHAKEDP